MKLTLLMGSLTGLTDQRNYTITRMGSLNQRGGIKRVVFIGKMDQRVYGITEMEVLEWLISG